MAEGPLVLLFGNVCVAAASYIELETILDTDKS